MRLAVGDPALCHGFTSHGCLQAECWLSSSWGSLWHCSCSSSSPNSPSSPSSPSKCPQPLWPPLWSKITAPAAICSSKCPMSKSETSVNSGIFIQWLCIPTCVLLNKVKDKSLGLWNNVNWKCLVQYRWGKSWELCEIPSLFLYYFLVMCYFP